MIFRVAWFNSLLVCILKCTLVHGQHINQYQLELGTFPASNQTPFWLRANQYGTIPLSSPVGRAVLGIQSDYQVVDSTGHRPLVDWGYGINVVANIGQTNQVMLPEAYIKGRLGAFELYAGRRKEVIGLMDTLLTTGSYIWSGNALPIPKIQLAIPKFTALPFTKGILSLMGAFSHGWFENADRLVKGGYLHQSSLYGRFGKPTWRIRLYGGFNHQVMWGGYSDYLGPSVTANGRLPSAIKYFPAVVFGTRNPFPDDPSIQTITNFEENRIGNHLGSVDLAADVNLGHWNLFLYRQFFYDDGSLFYGTNLEDGLNGIRLKNRNLLGSTPFFLRQITFEYLFTGSQGGESFILDDPQRRGRDDYFNNSQYLDGWTYFGHTIGTPFLTPQQEVNSSLPPRYGIANNRVSVFHLALSALLGGKVDVTTRLSFSRNAGSYANPYVSIPGQFSGLLTASIPVNLFGGTVLNGALALDSGELLPNSVGGYISLRKTGMFGRQQKPRSVLSPRWPFK
ncbi:capsule assembly Wzi family protein [Spirosoma aerolatum]|uniref:capsule assembly Wzi family protein n=1 Tax=Spirosoma aerolatum TaxID=1211326 RepID=UPI0009AD572C|nr:capsule assembly Wzi family protein [Spirosoma aerolatum]